MTELEPRETCRAAQCRSAVPATFLMCRRHWFMVPPSMRRAVMREYRPGQESDGRPSAAYLAAAAEAMALVALKEGLCTSVQSAAARAAADGTLRGLARLRVALARTGKTTIPPTSAEKGEAD